MRTTRSASTGSPSTVRAMAAASAVFHEVWKDGSYTGRRFNSLVSAQRYAKAIDGTVRAPDSTSG